MNFTDKELEYLSNEVNHKIRFDGYEFMWFANKGNGFELHSIMKKDTAKKISAIINFWIPKYKKELSLRVYNAERRDMIQEVMLEVEIFEILKSSVKTSKKIEKILNLNPNITASEVISYGLPSKSVYRYFSNL